VRKVTGLPFTDSLLINTGDSAQGDTVRTSISGIPSDTIIYDIRDSVYNTPNQQLVFADSIDTTHISPCTYSPQIDSVSGPDSVEVGGIFAVRGAELKSSGQTATIKGVSATIDYMSDTLDTIICPSVALGLCSLIVTDSCGNTSNAFPIMVWSSAVPPVHVSGPSGKSVTVGSDYVDTSHFTGATSFRWQTEFGYGGDPYWEDMFGRTDSILNYETVTSEINGWKFRCIGTNDDGSDTSTVATLTVTVPTVENDSIRPFRQYVNRYPPGVRSIDIYGGDYGSYVEGESYVIVNSIGRSDTLRSPELWSSTHITDTLLYTIPKGPKSVQVRRSDGVISTVSGAKDSLYLYQLRGSVR